MKCWKKSQSSSGYYNNFTFINFRRNADNSYNVEKRVGLGHPRIFKTIAKADNKTNALKKAKSYMKEHDKC